MRCSGCGEANEPDDAFCRWCGLPLAEAAPAETEDTRSGASGEAPAPRRARRRPPRWLIPVVSAVAGLAVLAATGWWVLARPPGSARSVPATLGMLPAMAQTPVRQWEVTAAEVSASCRTPGSAPAGASGRRCELAVHQWPDGSLVGTVSKGTPNRMRVSEAFGVDPDTGAVGWSQEGLVAVCSDPRFDSTLACVDGSSSQVFALDPATGERLWSQPFSGQAEHVEEVGGDLYIFAVRDGHELLTRITSRGREAWTVRVPADARRETAGSDVRPDLRTVLWDGVVYLNRVETESGASWTVDQDGGHTVPTEDSVMAVVSAGEDGDLQPVVRRPDGRLTLDGTAFIGIGGGGKNEPALYLPAAMDDRPDVPWLVVEDRGAPGSTVHAYAKDELDRELWDSAGGLPVAFCAGHKTKYDATRLNLGLSAIPALADTDVGTGGAVGFFCDGTRTIVLERGGVLAFTGRSDRSVWDVPFQGVTGGEASTFGLLVQQDAGSAVSLWR